MKKKYLHRWGEAAGGGEVTHGLGLIGAAFGLAISVGPVLGGSLSEEHRSTACILSSSVSMVAVLSLTFYGWKETAPIGQARGGAAARAIGGGAGSPRAAAANVNSAEGEREGEGAREGRLRSFIEDPAWQIVNPFLVLKIFLEGRWVGRPCFLCLLLCSSFFFSSRPRRLAQV